MIRTPNLIVIKSPVKGGSQNILGVLNLWGETDNGPFFDPDPPFLYHYKAILLRLREKS